MIIKTKTDALQDMPIELTPAQLDLVGGGGFRSVYGPSVEQQIEEARRLAKPFRDAGRAISNAISYVGNKIADFFGSVF